MRNNFDTVIERRATASTKWTKYGPDVLPFWVADMDFRAPEFVLEAIQSRTSHGIIGYTETPASLVQAFQHWLARKTGWQIDPDWLIWLPGVVPGLNLAAKASVRPGGGVLIPTPVYYPFLDVPAHCGGRPLHSPLILQNGRWEMDFDDLERLAPKADALLLSNPQNPTGRAYTQAELDRLAALCREHNLVLISDEIHADIILSDDATHVCVANDDALKPSSITLFAPTKTYNIPGLSCAVAVVPDADLRGRMLDARDGLLASPSPLAYAACEAAFNDQSDWVPDLLSYLRRNLSLLAAVAGDRMTEVEATYLAWIDVRDIPTAEIETHFLNHGLGLSIGQQFAGPGYVRFNFACPRATLEPGLERLARALK